MSVLIVPHPGGDEFVWPTLGGQVAAFLEEFACYGPGPLLGRQYEVAPEFRAWLYRAYEIWPRGTPREGRRRFSRCVLSKRKGLAKTEQGALVAAAEGHPDAPVRFGGWDASGEPVGVPNSSAYIPMLAYTDEQSEELAFGALHAVCVNSPLGDAYDVGLKRIDRRDGTGRLVHLATAPDSRDGARTTFMLIDETHRLTSRRQREAYTTMRENLFKIPELDPWMLELTTSFRAGDGSVAEDSFAEASLIADRKAKNPSYFFFHRQAVECDLSDDAALRSALIEATDPSQVFRTDVEALVAHYRAPNVDRSYFERVWLNWTKPSTDMAFDVRRCRELVGGPIPAGRTVGLAFDGSRSEDSTALLAIDLSSNAVQLLSLWEKPGDADDWEVDPNEVDAAVEHAFESYSVWRMYCDPPYWRSYIKKWEGQFGDRHVVEWWTDRRKQFAHACRSAMLAIQDGSLLFVPNEDLYSHIAHTHRQYTQFATLDGERLWYLRKAADKSPLKIDAAVGVVLCDQLRVDYAACSPSDRRRSHGSRNRLIRTF